MKKTRKTVIVCNGNFKFQAPLFIDAEQHEYAQINKQFYSIETLKYLGCKILY